MLFRRDNDCFLNEKYIKLKPKMTKNPKFSNFQSFYAIFVKFSTDFVDWNVEKSQQGTNLLSSSLFRRDLGRKISRWSAGVLFSIYFKVLSRKAFNQSGESSSISKPGGLGNPFDCTANILNLDPISSGLVIVLNAEKRCLAFSPDLHNFMASLSRS